MDSEAWARASAPKEISPREASRGASLLLWADWGGNERQLVVPETSAEIRACLVVCLVFLTVS